MEEKPKPIVTPRLLSFITVVILLVGIVIFFLHQKSYIKGYSAFVPTVTAKVKPTKIAITTNTIIDTITPVIKNTSAPVPVITTPKYNAPTINIITNIPIQTVITSTPVPTLSPTLTPTLSPTVDPNLQVINLYKVQIAKALVYEQDGVNPYINAVNNCKDVINLSQVNGILTPYTYQTAIKITIDQLSSDGSLGGMLGILESLPDTNLDALNAAKNGFIDDTNGLIKGTSLVLSGCETASISNLDQGNTLVGQYSLSLTTHLTNFENFINNYGK